MENEFPPNSHAQREERHARQPEKPSEKKEVRRITKGNAIQRKKPLYKQFLEAFRPEDNRGFVEYTLLEVLVPGIKDSIADATTSTIEHALGVDNGGYRRRSRRSSGGGGYTSYNRMSDSRRDRRDRDDDRRPSRRDTRMADDAREIILETRVEANAVIDQMYELLSKYDVVTMRDLLSMIGEPHNPTHEDWGWTSLVGARAHKIREGYLLDLPRPEALD